MKDIAQLYHNNFGVAFYWRKNGNLLTERVQMVFKETGFYLTENQLRSFADTISNCSPDDCCEGCGIKMQCHKFLLKTPIPEIDMAVTFNEYLQIKDLVSGALFNIDLMSYLSDVCKN
jgi:hypothetical protein